MTLPQSSDKNKSRDQLLQEIAELRLQLALKDQEIAALKPDNPAEKTSRFQSLFDSMSEGFALHEILLDSNGKPCDYRFLELNQAFERLTGLKKEAVVGKTVREVIPTIEPYWIEAFGTVALGGKTIRIENYAASLKNWYEVFAYCTAPGQFAALFSNITERKRSEESLEEARKALEQERNILQSMIDSVQNLHLAYLDPDFNFVHVNKAYGKTCGYTPDMMIGKNHFTLYPHEENEAIFASVRDSGIPVTFHDKPFVFPDQPDRGVTYWDWTLEPIKDASGKTEGLVFSLFETTERKQAEQALRESENRYHQLFENDLTGNFVCSSGGEILLCNQAFVNLFGFSSYEEAVGLNMSELYIDPVEREAILDLLKRAGRLEKYTTWRKRRNGDQIHIVENLVGSFNDEGELYEIQGYVYDDTERKRAEEALRLNEARFRTLVETSSDVLYLMSPDWLEMRQLQGGGFLTDTEKPNRDWLLQYIHPDDQPQVIAAIDEAIRSKSSFVFEHRVRQADGALGWTLSRAVPLLDENGDIIEWFGAASDITERKRTEKTLRQALAEAEEGRRLLEAMMEYIPMGITIADAPDVRIRRVSRYGRELTAKRREQIEGIPAEQHAENWQIFCADGVTPAANEDLPLTRATQKGEVVEEEEWVIARPDGTKIPILCKAAPIRDAEGRITGGVIGWQDITERKQAEEAIKSSLAEKEVMLKEIHHRVKNNMQVISSLVDLQAAEIEDPAIRKIFQDVVYRIRSMAMVHEKLYQSSDLAWLDFADYAQSFLGYLWRAQGSAASGIKLNLDLKPVLLSVNVAIPCGLILNELVSNALKHAFVGRDSGNVTVALHGDGQSRVRLVVNDDGIGLPAELDWEKSYSLGLRLVQMLARQIHAEVNVISDKGTGFTITFEKQKT